ncbi:DNA polymerase delta subunit 4-like protein [Drosera capensis]
MATPRVDMKAFYKNQKKKTVSKKPSSSKPRTATPKHSASVGSDAVQPPALVSRGGVDLQDDYDDKELFLRQFDLNMAYGPCIGISRVARWERANRMGLDPPREVEKLLKSGKANEQCVWDGRV